MTTEFDEAAPEESEQLDQLQADDSLVDRGVADVLDEAASHEPLPHPVHHHLGKSLVLRRGDEGGEAVAGDAEGLAHARLRVGLRGEGGEDEGSFVAG